MLAPVHILVVIDEDVRPFFPPSVWMTDGMAEGRGYATTVTSATPSSSALQAVRKADIT